MKKIKFIIVFPIVFGLVVIAGTIVNSQAYSGLLSSSIQLISPNGGQCLKPGSIINIYWSQTTSVNHVAFYFSPNGYNPRPSAYFYMSNPEKRYYNWTVPDIPTTQGVIWVVAHDINHIEDISDTNDSYFSIMSNCSSPTPVPILSSTPTPTPILTPTPSLTLSSTPTPTPTPSTSSGPIPTPSATPTSSATPTPTPTPTPSLTHSPTPTPTPIPPTLTQTPTPTPTPSLTPIVTTRPSAPTNLKALIKNDKVALIWTDNYNNETAYRINRRPAGNVLTTTKTVSENTTNYTDDNLTGGTYEYDISACNSYGCSDDSNIVIVSIGTAVSVESKILNGNVLYSDGQPVINAKIGAYSKDNGAWVNAETDNRGYYELRLKGGVWQIAPQPKDSSSQWLNQYSITEFARDNIQESKTQNFSIPIADGKLIISAFDDSNNPIANVGITADSVSASQSSPVLDTTSGTFVKTDSSGKATINLKSGTYYIKGHISSDSNYVNPSEQSIIIGSGETRDVKLIFPRKASISPIYINGVARLDDGTPAQAHIWAWAENGGSANTKSSADGSFSIQISGNTTWHIKAGQEINLLPYKSSEISAIITNKTVLLELILTANFQIPLAPKTVDTKSTTQDIITTTQDGAQVKIPANTVTTTNSITVEVKPTIEAPSQPSARVIGNAYDIAVRDQNGQPLKQFNQDIQVEIPYKESDLQAQGINEDSLALSYFDETVGSWVKINSFTIDKNRNVIIAKVNHLTLFAIVLAADVVPPSPPSSVKATALGEGNIVLSWLNPSKDWDHLNIYRSENPSSLGKLQGITSDSTFTDSADIQNGITYYYVVRSIDSAGNETSNTTPVAIKALGNSQEPSSLREGDMISAAGSNDPDIYIINVHGYKRLFLNPIIFNFYGHLGGFQNVKNVQSSTRNYYKTSGFFQNCETNDPKVYGVEITGEDSGILHWINISGSQAVTEDANFFKKTFCINSNEFNWYGKGLNYTSLSQVPNYLERVK